jgi:hypothetical protein
MMTRETWVRRNGKMVLKHKAGPRSDRVHVISDNLGDALEHHAYADGRRTDSKSQFRRWTREAGVVEKGNDRERPKPVREQSIVADVAQAYQMVKQGYRPRLLNIEGD